MFVFDFHDKITLESNISHIGRRNIIDSIVPAGKGGVSSQEGKRTF